MFDREFRYGLAVATLRVAVGILFLRGALGIASVIFGF